ncbi:MAG: single-stranded DNA-binding protein [Planctomycetota bacterium]
MANLNKVLLIGNLTRDPELRYIQSGTAVVDLGLAVNRRVKKSDGTWGDEAAFIDVTVWGKQAENCAEYLSKGRPVFVEGRLQFDQWEDKKTGEKRSKLKVTADNVQFLAGRPGGGGGGEGGRPASAPKPEPAAEDTELSDDDIPF